MLIAFCVLLAPLAITAMVALMVPRWWSGLFLLIALIPPVRAAILIHRMFTSDADISLTSLYPPFILAALELVGLWIAWYMYDPKSAGEVLAITEGVAAGNHFKNGRPFLGSVTAAGAVSQWEHSASLDGDPTPAPQPSVRTSAKPPRRRREKGQRASSVPASEDSAQTLRELVHLHSQGALSNDEFLTAKARLLGGAEYPGGERAPIGAILVSKTGTAHLYGCQHLPDDARLIAPDWGWITDARQWQRIGTRQLPATEGNTSRVAVRRCLDCDW